MTSSARRRWYLWALAPLMLLLAGSGLWTAEILADRASAIAMRFAFPAAAGITLGALAAWALSRGRLFREAPQAPGERAPMRIGAMGAVILVLVIAMRSSPMLRPILLAAWMAGLTVIVIAGIGAALLRRGPFRD